MNQKTFMRMLDADGLKAGNGKVGLMETCGAMEEIWREI